MTLKDFVDGTVVGTVDLVIMPLLYTLAFFFFIYGIARTFFSSNDEKRQEGRKFALWGVIALAVMFSVWGLVRLFLGVIDPTGASSSGPQEVRTQPGVGQTIPNR